MHSDSPIFDHRVTTLEVESVLRVRSKINYIFLTENIDWYLIIEYWGTSMVNRKRYLLI